MLSLALSSFLSLSHILLFFAILIAIFRGHTSAFHAWLAFNCHCYLAGQTDRQTERVRGGRGQRQTAWIGFDLSEISRCRIAQIDWNYYKSLSISRICIENVNGKLYVKNVQWNLICSILTEIDFNVNFHTLHLFYLGLLLYLPLYLIWALNWPQINNNYGLAIIL